jgi:hypothetical protein
VRIARIIYVKKKCFAIMELSWSRAVALVSAVADRADKTRVVSPEKILVEKTAIRVLFFRQENSFQDL